jgi:hypothetical protein
MELDCEDRRDGSENDDDSASLEPVLAKRTIYSDQGDPEVDSLYNRYKRGKLVVQSDFQRRFVWDRAKSSRLMESALLDVPLPVIYLSQENDGKEYVIDGQQRLTAFFSFIDGAFPDGKPFLLTNLRVFTELIGKSYVELAEGLQDKIRFCKIRAITFRKESQPDLKFEIFERLNTGAVPLNDQELRNCIYRGPYNDLLKELSRDEDFRSLLGFQTPDKRMKDVEYVLRFAAFFHATYLKYKPSIARFLNEDMRTNQFMSADSASKLRQAFKNAVSLTKSAFGDHAFKRFFAGTEDNRNGYWEPHRFNVSLYDVLMYTFAREDKNRVMQNLDSIREALIHLMTRDQQFIDAIELGTSGSQSVTRRFDIWRQYLQQIIGVGQKEPRCFSLFIKKQLFEENNVCALCGQSIHDIDDAEIDHDIQFWRGGKTVPENARLTHRFCNRARSRLDTGSEAAIVNRSQRHRNSVNVTPRETYRPLILKALILLGGAAKQSEVLAVIENEMSGRLTADDLSLHSDGYQIKWKCLAAFERLQMVQDGLLRNDSAWGTWELTAQGEQLATGLD